MATPTSAISVYYLVLFMCTTLVLFVCTTLVLFMCTTLVVFMCSTLVVFMCSTLVLFSFVWSTLVLFVCSTLVLFVCTTNSHTPISVKLIDTIYIKTQVFRFLRYYSPAPRNIARSDWATQNITHNMTSSIT